MNYFEGPNISNVNGANAVRRAISAAVSSIEITASKSASGQTPTANQLIEYLQYIITTKLTPIMDSTLL